MANFFKNPIIHGIAVFAVSLLSLVVQSGSPVLTVTVGAIAAGIIAWMTKVLG